jgi:hypothetical protein
LSSSLLSTTTTQSQSPLACVSGDGGVCHRQNPMQNQRQHPFPPTRRRVAAWSLLAAA